MSQLIRFRIHLAGGSFVDVDADSPDAARAVVRKANSKAVIVKTKVLKGASE